MKRHKMRRGVTLMEILVAVFVLSMTIVTTTAMFSSSALLRTRSGGYSRAATLVNRKLEQVRKLDATQLTSSGLIAAGVVDTNAGTGPNYTFTTVDQLTNELSLGTGTLSLTNAGTDLARVDVTISWKSYRGKVESVSAATYVADKRAWKEP
jgi:Tfp pilus assembly protein PilV